MERVDHWDPIVREGMGHKRVSLAPDRHCLLDTAPEENSINTCVWGGRYKKVKRAETSGTFHFHLSLCDIYDPKIHTGAPRKGLLLPSSSTSRNAVLNTCGKNHSKVADKLSVHPLVSPISQSTSLFCHRIFPFRGGQS